MELVIDTTEKGQMIFQILAGRNSLAKFKKITEKLSEEVLLELQKFLKKNKISLKQVDKIFVNPGPGVFSSTRTGVAVANALSFALGIPVAEAPKGEIKEIIVPKYDKEPNITKPKRRTPLDIPYGPQ